ncbi:MAG: rhodanese-like domain-containing protein [Candidatus Woesearchaeota archaeon]
MRNALFIGIICIVAAISSAAGALVAWKILEAKPDAKELIRDYYATEVSVHVSPHSMRKQMDKNDTSFILVDLRSPEEYKHEHIKGAINIPAYKDKYTSNYAVDFIVGEFSKLPKDKDIIVYCYSIPCMTGRKIGKILADHDIFVKHLNIGWNEWRYDWNSWNHEHEWNTTKVLDYIESGEN